MKRKHFIRQVDIDGKLKCCIDVYDGQTQLFYDLKLDKIFKKRKPEYTQLSEKYYICQLDNNNKKSFGKSHTPPLFNSKELAVDFINSYIEVKKLDDITYNNVRYTPSVLITNDSKIESVYIRKDEAYYSDPYFTIQEMDELLYGKIIGIVEKSI